MRRIKIFNTLKSKGSLFNLYIIITLILLIFFLTSQFWFPNTSDIVSEDYGVTFEAQDYYIKVDNAHYDTENKLLTFEYYIKSKFIYQSDTSKEEKQDSSTDINKFQSYNANVNPNSINISQDDSVDESEIKNNEEIVVPTSSLPILLYVTDEKNNKFDFTFQKDENDDFKYYCSAKLEKECDVIMIYFSTTIPEYSDPDTLDEFGNTIKGEVHEKEMKLYYSKIDFREVIVGKNNSVVPVPTTSQTSTTTPTTITTQTSSVTTTATTINHSVVEKNKSDVAKAMKKAKITKLSVKSSSKNKISASWKKVNRAVGYEVQVSPNQSFKKVIFNKDTNKTKLTIKNSKIKTKKTYYLRVRAYATYQNIYGKVQKVYSNWNKKISKIKVK